MSGSSAPGEANGSAEERGSRQNGSGRSRAKERLTELMEEFQRRQAERPELVVRPWWTSAGDGTEGGDRRITGFVVEYCPRGVESAELALRPDRVRVEGPRGLREAPLDLETGWRLAGQDVGGPQLMTNHLLSMADRLLGEAA